MKKRRNVSHMRVVEAEEFCEQKNGNFEVDKDGNIFVEWHECEAKGCSEPIESDRNYCRACGGVEDKPVPLNEGPMTGGAKP